MLLLVTMDPTKLEKTSKLNIPILSEDDFIKMLDESKIVLLVYFITSLICVVSNTVT
jgi:hypothetical protein